MEKPDPTAKPAIDFDNKICAEREKQIKVIVPNSTAGMIIGNGYMNLMQKVEKIFKSSLDSISIPSPSTSAKIQIMGGKVCLMSIGKSLLGVVNKLLKTKSLLTSPSNVLPLHFKQIFPPII